MSDCGLVPFVWSPHKAGFTNCEQLPGNSRANGRPQCNLDQNNPALAALLELLEQFDCKKSALEWIVGCHLWTLDYDKGRKKVSGS